MSTGIHPRAGPTPCGHCGQSPLLLFLLQLAQQQLQRADRDLQLAQRKEHRKDHQDQRDGEEPLPDDRPTFEQGEHAHHAQEQTEHAENLHIPNQMNAVTQIANLRQQVFIAFSLVFAMQIADDGCQRVEAVGIGQHQQRHSREKEGGSGNVHFFAIIPFRLPLSPLILTPVPPNLIPDT